MTTQASLLFEYSTLIDQTSRITQCGICGRVVDSSSGTVILLCHIGKVYLLFEKKAYQLPVVNINSNNDGLKAKLSLVLFKHHTMKMYRVVEEVPVFHDLGIRR
ncbi:hypothetical protein L798_11335 [Zootermopsis nevadensis]|uniref:Uncharacterized protein n=1 Tax=Zootermopsis nevadensis TaxID=136037 RepID=A0A067QTN6_ZOONE|nr:hypothetical protein L798_11335 [Zootermopsis nevadensis]